MVQAFIWLMAIIWTTQGGSGSNGTFKVTNYSPVTFNANTATWSWSGFDTATIVVQIDGTLTNGGSIDVWDEIPIVFEDIDDQITVTSAAFEGYEVGAILGRLDTSVNTNSFDLTEKTFLEISGQNIKLKDEFYFDPQNNEVVNTSDNTYYKIDNDTNVSILSYQSASNDINLVDEISLLDIFSVASDAAIPLLRRHRSGNKAIIWANKYRCTAF